MKKTTKIIGVIAILILLGVGFYFGFSELSVYGGGTVLSMSQVTFDSNHPGIQGNAFLVTFAQTSLGQHIYGTFTANEINSKLQSNEKVDTGFRLDVFGSDTICNYNINRQSLNEQTLYKLYLIDEGRCGGIYTSCTTKQNTCSSNGGIFLRDESSWLTSSNWACVAEKQRVPVGKVEFNREDFNAEIKVTADGVSYSEKINNRDGGVNILNDKIVVDWVGNLGTGEQCPTADEKNVMASYVNNRWTFTNIDRYNTWRTITTPNPEGVPSNFNRCIRDGWQSGESGSTLVNKCISAFNRETDDALRQASFTSDGGTSAIASGDTDDGKVTINTGRQLSFPVFTMRIQADMLGVYVPVAEPKIERVVCDEFTSGYMGFARVDVRNFGEVGGSARLSVVCQPPISVSTPASNMFLEPNILNSYNFALTGDGSGSVSCTAQVREAGTNKITDTKQFTCSLKGVGTSDPKDGDKRCSTGGTYEIYNNGRWNVIKPVPNPMCQDGQIDPPKEPVDWLLIGFLIVAGVGIGVAIFIRLKREGYFDK